MTKFIENLSERVIYPASFSVEHFLRISNRQVIPRCLVSHSFGKRSSTRVLVWHRVKRSLSYRQETSVRLSSKTQANETRNGCP